MHVGYVCVTTCHLCLKIVKILMCCTEVYELFNSEQEPVSQYRQRGIQQAAGMNLKVFLNARVQIC